MLVGILKFFHLRISIRAPVFISRVLLPPAKWASVCTHHTPSPRTHMGTDTGACWGVSSRQSRQPPALHTLGQRLLWGPTQERVSTEQHFRQVWVTHTHYRIWLLLFVFL